MTEFKKTAKTTVRRRPTRAVYDRDAVLAILDEGMVCHLGYSAPDGSPFVIPTLYGRDGETIYLHGSAISRSLDTIGKGIPVCLTVTLIDAMVLARSPFHHSMNYRSVMIFGVATPVLGKPEKLHAMAVITNHLLPGRWEETRTTTDVELNATHAMSIRLSEVSAKVRTGGPVDDGDDLALPIWAGVVPVRLSVGEPERSRQSPLEVDAPEPPSIAEFAKRHTPRS